MYGIVNNGIQELVVSNFGLLTWEAVKKRSQVDIDYFISSEPYPDEITYKLAIAVSEETGTPLFEVLRQFGHYWVLVTGKQKYGVLMQAGGSSLPEFLNNLPMFHSRLMLIYPKLSPPEFRVEMLGPTSAEVHYYSSRVGLQPMMIGLLEGLGMMFELKTEVKMIQSRDEGADHDVFTINW
jgi:hypothetical protein